MLAVAGLLSACGNDKPDTPRPRAPRAVGIAVDEGLATRMGRYDSLSDLLTLGVFGFSTGTDLFDPDHTISTHTPNLLDNVEVTRDTIAGTKPYRFTPWSYNPVAVWPSDTLVNNTFFAYAPYMESGQTVGTDGHFEVDVTGGAPILKFRPPQNISEQVDLLYSEYNSNVTDINANKNNGEVLYKMKHAMLWVRFLIATRDMDNDPTDDEFYTITEFRFIGGHIMAAAAFDLGTATWSPDPEFAGTDDGYGEAVYEFDYLYDHPYKIMAGEVVRLGAALHRSYLMIIPHNFVTDINETSVELSFLHDPDGEGGESYESEHFVSIPFPDVKLGEPGNTLVYVVRVSTSGTYIEFAGSSTIKDWIEEESNRETEVF
jgi:hypothetical protein